MLARLSLKHEIILLLLIKLALLFFIWKICFSHPLDKKFSPRDVESHFLNSPVLTINLKGQL